MKAVVRIVLIALGVVGCIQFNDTCDPDSSEIVGDTARSLDVRSATVSTQEAPVGNLVADAFREATNADFALVPAQSFQQGTDCGVINFINRGPVRANALHDLLPEVDTVVVMSVTSDTLQRVLEHSVAALRPGGGAAESPGFLQVSNVFFSVDCSQQAQTLSGDGAAIAFPGQRVPPGSITVGTAAIQPGQNFHLATTSTLANGALGYVDLTAAKILIDTGKIPTDVVADYLRSHSPINPGVEGRILLGDTCK